MKSLLISLNHLFWFRLTFSIYSTSILILCLYSLFLFSSLFFLYMVIFFFLRQQVMWKKIHWNAGSNTKLLHIPDRNDWNIPISSQISCNTVLENRWDRQSIKTEAINFQFITLKRYLFHENKKFYIFSRDHFHFLTIASKKNVCV